MLGNVTAISMNKFLKLLTNSHFTFFFHDDAFNLSYTVLLGSITDKVPDHIFCHLTLFFNRISDKFVTLVHSFQSNFQNFLRFITTIEADTISHTTIRFLTATFSVFYN